MIPSQQVLYAVSWPKPYKISLDDYLKIKKKSKPLLFCKLEFIKKLWRNLELISIVRRTSLLLVVIKMEIFLYYPVIYKQISPTSKMIIKILCYGI